MIRTTFSYTGYLFLFLHFFLYAHCSYGIYRPVCDQAVELPLSLLENHNIFDFTFGNDNCLYIIERSSKTNEGNIIRIVSPDSGSRFISSLIEPKLISVYSSDQIFFACRSTLLKGNIDGRTDSLLTFIDNHLIESITCDSLGNLYYLYNSNICRLSPEHHIDTIYKYTGSDDFREKPIQVFESPEGAIYFCTNFDVFSISSDTISHWAYAGYYLSNCSFDKRNILWTFDGNFTVNLVFNRDVKGKYKFDSSNYAYSMSSGKIMRTSTPVPYPSFHKVDQSRDQTRPSFSWSPIPDIKRYVIQISYDRYFSTLYSRNWVNDTTYTVPSELPPGTYYWTVKGNNLDFPAGQQFSVMNNTATYSSPSAMPEKILTTAPYTTNYRTYTITGKLISSKHPVSCAGVFLYQNVGQSLRIKRIVKLQHPAN